MLYERQTQKAQRNHVFPGLPVEQQYGLPCQWNSSMVSLSKRDVQPDWVGLKTGVPRVEIGMSMA